MLAPSMTPTLTTLAVFQFLYSISQFGLNPQEWTVSQALTPTHFLLTHIDDPEFQMIGELNHGTLKSLEVVSL